MMQGRFIMYVIVGLQNPGAKYEQTRHNAGGIAVRTFCENYKLPSLVSSAQYSGEVSEGVLEGKDVRVLLPTTFMNASGTAVGKALAKEKSSELIVVYDDLDLPVGTFKLSYGRGSGGHNGLDSVMRAVGTKEFVRVRIGIAPVSLFGNIKRPSGGRVSPFVLKNFTRRERAKLDAILPKIVQAIYAIVTEGRAKAMNEFN